MPVNKVWLHGSSLGDVNALRALTVYFARQQCSLICSACTQSGKARWQSWLDDPHFLPRTHLKLLPAPLWSRRRALQSLHQEKPDLLILELLEIWPPWIKSWIQAGVKVVVVDGRISKNTLKYRFYLAQSFRMLSLFLAQTPLDAERAIYMGCPPERVQICGDAKLDSLLSSQVSEQDNDEQGNDDQDAMQNKNVQQILFDLILSCTRSKDEKHLIKPLKLHLEKAHFSKVLIAPRQLKTVPRLLHRLRHNHLRYKVINHEDLYNLECLQTIKNDSTQLWILNCYGYLSKLYTYAHCTVIGGTFYNKGQNLIEAAQAGCGVIYGPNIERQRAQVEMISKGGYSVRSWQEALDCARRLQKQLKQEIGVNPDALNVARGAARKQVMLIGDLFT